jgi:hypothetical protein
VDSDRLGLTESNRPAFSIPGGQIAPKAFRANDGGNHVALGSGQDHPFEYRSLDRVDPGLRAHRHLRISMAPLALIFVNQSDLAARPTIGLKNLRRFSARAKRRHERRSASLSAVARPVVGRSEHGAASPPLP